MEKKKIAKLVFLSWAWGRTISPNYKAPRIRCSALMGYSTDLITAPLECIRLDKMLPTFNETGLVTRNASARPPNLGFIRGAGTYFVCIGIKIASVFCREYMLYSQQAREKQTNSGGIFCTCSPGQVVPGQTPHRSLCVSLGKSGNSSEL